jgi:hypothetical protein
MRRPRGGRGVVIAHPPRLGASRDEGLTWG